MALIGYVSLVIAFAATALSVVALLTGHLMGGMVNTRTEEASVKAGISKKITLVGRLAVIISAIALTFSCGLLVYCFMTGDSTLEYVLREHSDSTSNIAWLYKLSGLWAGREGSLLFWAWLISVFDSVVALRGIKKLKVLDNVALLVGQLVLVAFVGVLLFSENNMPFVATLAQYLDENGNPIGAASMWGLNALLEHWAMAIHPPTLFVGYAGLTIPFAYAVAALVVNDSSKLWVERSTRITIFSWLFLGFGIGLGGVWAYVVLGWGGYWGWDPVENASLLSWLVGLALIHSFTVYRQRGAFKRWSVMCACLTFAFVIVGTFISRSGLVQSVHAFEGDMISLVLFLALIVLAVLIGIAGLAWRWSSFAADREGGGEFESFLSKDVAYYFNNVIMVVFAFLLAYLTISSALPSWLPFGGEAVSAGTYNAIARPLGVIYLMILAVCPLLSWGKTEGKLFLKRARIPALAAAVLFVLLLVYFFLVLLPSYNETVALGGTSADMLLEQGPSIYYNGLALVGLAVASLLFFNSLYLLAKGVRGYMRSHKTHAGAGVVGLFRGHASTYGGFLAHFAMSIILVGLIGSSMYTTERVSILPYNVEDDSVSKDLVIKDYTLKYQGSSMDIQPNGDDVFYQTDFEVYKNDEYLGTVHPSIQLVKSTQQQKLNASVMSFPLEDLFVVYQGVDNEGNLSMDVRVNPLIMFVWVGFGILMVGVLLALVGRRTPRRPSELSKEKEE